MKRLFGCILVILGLAALNASAVEKKNPADTNGDGKVSKQEDCDAEARKAEKAGKEFNKAATEKKFAKKDKNGDGFLDADELAGKAKTPTAPDAPEEE